MAFRAIGGTGRSPGSKGGAVHDGKGDRVQLAAKCDLDMSSVQSANVVVANVREALVRPHEGLVVEKRGRDSMVYRFSAP